MSEHLGSSEQPSAGEKQSSGEQPFDVATIARDDALLDALGRGEPPHADDDVAVLLAAWRTDLSRDVGQPPSSVDREQGLDGRGVGGRPVGGHGRRVGGRGRRVALAAAAAVVAFIAGLTVAAGSAGPDSPLWPVTRLVYADRADSRLAEQEASRTIARARQAVGEARYADAASLLDEATVLIGRIDDQPIAKRLLDEVAAVRALLPGSASASSAPPGGTPTVAPAPGSSTGAPAGQPGGGGPGGSPGGGEPTPAGGGGPVPGLPLPSLPSPSLPLPSLSPLPLPPLLR